MGHRRSAIVGLAVVASIAWSCIPDRRSLDVASSTSDGGAVVDATAPTSAVVGPQGGNVSSSDGAVVLEVPAGALPSDVTITVTPIADPLPGAIGTAYEIGPSGTTCAVPVARRLKWDAAAVGDVPVDEITIATVVDGAWQPLAEGALDREDRSATTLLDHLSPYALYRRSAKRGCVCESPCFASSCTAAKGTPSVFGPADCACAFGAQSPLVTTWAQDASFLKCSGLPLFRGACTVCARDCVKARNGYIVYAGDAMCWAMMVPRSPGFPADVTGTLRCYRDCRGANGSKDRRIAPVCVGGCQPVDAGTFALQTVTHDPGHQNKCSDTQITDFIQSCLQGDVDACTAFGNASPANDACYRCMASKAPEDFDSAPYGPLIPTGGGSARLNTGGCVARAQPDSAGIDCAQKVDAYDQCVHAACAACTVEAEVAGCFAAAETGGCQPYRTAVDACVGTLSATATSCFAGGGTTGRLQAIGRVFCGP